MTERQRERDRERDRDRERQRQTEKVGALSPVDHKGLYQIS